MYEQIITSGKNPYTNQDLPDHIVSKIKLSMKSLTYMGINCNNPLSIIEAFDSLETGDTINDQETDSVVATSLCILSSYGVTKEILNSTKNSDFFRITNDPIYKALTKEHAIKTFCHYYCSIIQTDRDRARNIAYGFTNALI
jgi:hypothetical protein